MKMVPYFKIAQGVAPRAPGTYGPADIGRAYQFPTSLKDPQTAVAIIELGGGYRAADIAAYCRQYSVPLPILTDVSVGGATNSPGDSADVEVLLDIQVAAGAYSYCTGARATVYTYFADDIAAAVLKIVADIKAGVKIGAVTISWGAPEVGWGAAACRQQDAAFAQLAALGVPFFAASGDSLSGDGSPGVNVDFPASSPNVIGCGGTTRTAASEVVWNDRRGGGGGGGYSVVFPRQAWQAGVPAQRGRMVPDVAGNADPATGYNIVYNGQGIVVGGTSAVSPLYAGLFAALNVRATAPALWQHPTAFSDIVLGDNGAYKAAVGPDACTGLGSPIGTALLAQLAGVVTVPNKIVLDLDRKAVSVPSGWQVVTD